MNEFQLPEHCTPIGDNEKFSFSCHPGVPCFNECCRQLDLALTPYDVLRLKTRLNRHSGMFLEQFVIIEWEEGMLFPACYLTMVDDGKASCVFVKEHGCRIYEDRPAACRAYPIGRGASRLEDGTVTEQFVLLKEPHCCGFEEKQEYTPREYFENQGLAEYNRYNDQLMKLLQHPKIQSGFRPTKAQAEQYIMALYNLDTFRQELSSGSIQMNTPLSPMEQQAMQDSDNVLLLVAIRWLIQEYFGE
ncbi:MAG: YkgJ family cysteine cluster protein [Candidatus Electrothrix sp. AR4]|nr:YkgJ family cysteine cluster protein [Candidatus Electrothrix sp. AR4]